MANIIISLLALLCIVVGFASAAIDVTYGNSTIVIVGTQYGSITVAPNPPLTVAYGPFTIQSQPGASSYAVTKVGVVVRFYTATTPAVAVNTFDGPFWGAVYASDVNGLPTGAPITQASLPKFDYLQKDFGASFRATKFEFPVPAAAVQAGSAYFITFSSNNTVGVYSSDLSPLRKQVYSINQAAPPSDGSVFLRDDSYGNQTMSLYMIVTTDATPAATTNPATTNQSSASSLSIAQPWAIIAAAFVLYVSIKKTF